MQTTYRRAADDPVLICPTCRIAVECVACVSHLSRFSSAHDTSEIIPLILSGGAGTRLWPLSRKRHRSRSCRCPTAKHCLAKPRAARLDLPGVVRLLTVTNRDYYFNTKDVYASVDIEPAGGTTFLLEPFGRNTAPAIALRCAIRRVARIRQRGAARAARRSFDPRFARVCRRGRARRGAGAEGHAS